MKVKLFRRQTENYSPTSQIEREGEVFINIIRSEKHESVLRYFSLTWHKPYFLGEKHLVHNFPTSSQQRPPPSQSTRVTNDGETFWKSE